MQWDFLSLICKFDFKEERRNQLFTLNGGGVEAFHDS